MQQKMLLAAAGLLLFASACNRSDDDEPVGGKGGNATLRITSRHHTRTIDSITVYLKYNASNLPTVFDDSAMAVKTSTDTVATFTGLKKGRYYIYGKGWDRNIVDTVVGGIPYEITQETSINLNLPVTEGD